MLIGVGVSCLILYSIVSYSSASCSGSITLIGEEKAGFFGPSRLFEPRYEKNIFFAYEKTKTQISCTVTAQLISAFDFAIWIVQSFLYLNPKF